MERHHEERNPSRVRRSSSQSDSGPSRFSDQEHIGQRTFQRDRETDKGFRDRDYGRRSEFSGRSQTGYGSDLGDEYQDMSQNFTGRGPKGYRRSDDRIKEEVCDCLSDDRNVDASDIEVKVKDGEVTLTGTVDSRRTKRMAEDLACEVSGVSDVSNQIKIRRDSESSSQNMRH